MPRGRVQVETFDADGFRINLAAAVGVDPDLVTLEISAGSVVVVAAIAIPTTDASNAAGEDGSSDGGGDGFDPGALDASIGFAAGVLASLQALSSNTAALA